MPPRSRSSASITPPLSLRERLRRHAKTETGPNDVAKAVLIELEALGPDAIHKALTEALPLFARNVIDTERNRTKRAVPHTLPPDPDPPGKLHTRAHMGSAKSRRVAAHAAWSLDWEAQFYQEQRTTPSGFKRYGDWTPTDWDAAARAHQNTIDANQVGLRQAAEMAAALRSRGLTLTRELPTGETARIMAPALV